MSAKRKTKPDIQKVVDTVAEDMEQRVNTGKPRCASTDEKMRQAESGTWRPMDAAWRLEYRNALKRCGCDECMLTLRRVKA